MTDREDAFWNELNDRLAQERRDVEMSLADAEQVMAEAGETPIPSEEIDAMVARATRVRVSPRRYGWAAVLLIAPLLALGLGFFKMWDAAPGAIRSREWDYPVSMQHLLSDGVDESDRRVALGRVTEFLFVSIEAVIEVRDQGGALGQAAEAALAGWRRDLTSDPASHDLEVAPVLGLVASLRDRTASDASRLTALEQLQGDVGDGLVALRRPLGDSLEIDRARLADLEDLTALLDD